MGTPYRRDVERLRYWQGQGLRSRDFRDQARLDAVRRALHDRALHATGGVALGLAVARVDGDPSRLRVACGLAYDRAGRAVVLERPRDIAEPEEPSWLLIRPRPEDAAAASCCGSGDPGCGPDSPVLRAADAELAWMPLASVEPIDGVVLARFLADLDPGFQAPQARPLARPRLARGQTVRGNTPWQPWAVDQLDGQGGVVSRVVGVQTRIDTSAAGFTSTPVYAATLDAPGWDVATAEFAPAFFPHVADPSVDGFTFRLLMVETARRRYTAAPTVTRVEAATRGAGDGLSVRVADTAGFQRGDPIALLRPRARTIVGARSSSERTITLEAPLDGVTANETVLAIGHRPRTAKVVDVAADDATAVAGFLATPAIRKGDLLLRVGDGEMAVIASVSNARRQLTVKNPFTGWLGTDTVRVARMARAPSVSSAAIGGVELELSPATHGVTKGALLAVIDGDGAPLGGVRTVETHAGTSIGIAPALTAAETAAAARVAVFAADVAIQSVLVKSPGIRVEVDTTQPFDEGDFVAVAGAPAAIASIVRVTASSKTLALDTTMPVAVGDDLVAATWIGAATVSRIVAGPPMAVTIGRTGAVPDGAFVVRRAADDGLSAPSPVTAVNGPTLTLATPLADLARLDTLAIGVFPRVVTVLSQQADPTHIQIVAAQAGQLAAGDQVALLGASPAVVAQVAAVNGNAVVLSESIGPLAAGQALGVVHFIDQATVERVGSPTSLTLDAPRMLRGERDVVGVRTHYADVSNPGVIDRIAADELVLALPSLEAGDGIVDAGWIDGGVLGAASLSHVPSDPSPEWRVQLLVRLAATDGLEQFQPAVAFGLDLLTGRPTVSAVVAFVFGTAGAGTGQRVFVWSTEPGVAFRYRPETLSLITTFNTDFPRAFATFAQKQRLAVSWMACEGGFPRPAGCPGARPGEICADPAPGA